MPNGKVKEYDGDRGCGSIIDTTGKLLIVYANYVHLAKGETLTEGQEVSYEIENRRHENWAINVRIAA